MRLSEYLTESIVPRKTGVYKIYDMDENTVRKGIFDHLYVNVSDELMGRTEDAVVSQLIDMTRGECLWAEFADEETGDIIYLLSCKDRQVGKLVFDSGYPVYGRIYEKKGSKLVTVTENIEKTLKYYERWIKYEPF